MSPANGLIKPMDVVIISNFVQMTEEEARGWEGTRVFVDEANRRRD